MIKARIKAHCIFFFCERYELKVETFIPHSIPDWILYSLVIDQIKETRGILWYKRKSFSINFIKQKQIFPSSRKKRKNLEIISKTIIKCIWYSVEGCLPLLFINKYSFRWLKLIEVKIKLVILRSVLLFDDSIYRKALKCADVLQFSIFFLVKHQEFILILYFNVSFHFSYLFYIFNGEFLFLFFFFRLKGWWWNWKCFSFFLLQLGKILLRIICEGTTRMNERKEESINKPFFFLK